MQHKVIAITLICVAAVAAAVAQQTTELWHTSPDKWKEPRTFHRPSAAEMDDRISITHEELFDTKTPKTLSPNKAYWFTVNTSEDAASCHKDGDRFTVSAADASVHIFTEQKRLTKITFGDHYPNFALEVRWINEKLLYIEVWWGRAVGSSLIFDVEHEKFVHKETVHDGVIPFQQFRRAREEGVHP